jgi:DNA modification methylase
MGSGSTGRGAVLEGFGFIGIEKEPDYFAIAQARIAACDAAVTQRAAGDPPVEEPDGSDLPLFGGIE